MKEKIIDCIRVMSSEGEEVLRTDVAYSIGSSIPCLHIICFTHSGLENSVMVGDDKVPLSASEVEEIAYLFQCLYEGQEANKIAAKNVRIASVLDNYLSTKEKN